ncbi:MAG: nikR [Proteobacteria bacterium]|nr:nikR [Pseudomonadota bacterium]
MERITITIEEDLLSEIDKLSQERGYKSRSEVFRDMAREALAREKLEKSQTPDSDQLCHGALTYVYDHGVRDLPNRLTDNHHAHNAISISTMHVHVSADDCLEVSILAGTAAELRRFADSVISQRGVRHGSLHVIPASAGQGHSHTHSHGHSHAHHHHDHDHDHGHEH